MKKKLYSWLFPLILLVVSYGLLALTRTEIKESMELMERCVLMDAKLSRIWSVGNVEIAMSYFGVFSAMLWYFFAAYKNSRQHLIDISIAVIYVFVSFLVDLVCVKLLEPFFAMFIGDSIVLVFTVFVSRQAWFSRLLGVFVPLVFLTCSLGHFMEGISYWYRTYPLNVPWTMVTADIGFAILLNTVRFPAFLRGQDFAEELERTKKEKEALENSIEIRNANALKFARFTRDVLATVTEDKFVLCYDENDFPEPLSNKIPMEILDVLNISSIRKKILNIGVITGLAKERLFYLETSAGEALGNALKHGGGGNVYISYDSDEIQFSIVDYGKGISPEDIPNAALRMGWSTRSSEGLNAGMGFKLITEMSDRIYLLSTAEGTRITIVMNRDPNKYILSQNIVFGSDKKE